MRRHGLTTISILAALAALMVAAGCSSLSMEKIAPAVTMDVALEDQKALNEEFVDRKAWTRMPLEDLTERAEDGEPKKRIVPRDTKVEIVGLNFTYNGAVIVLDKKNRKISHGLEIERPLTVAKYQERLNTIFWFDDPMMRQVSHIRLWGKKTARAVAAHEVFIGMPAEAALESWGVPTKVNKTEIGGGTEEQWVYKEARRSRYIYIKDGKVTKYEA